MSLSIGWQNFAGRGCGCMPEWNCGIAYGVSLLWSAAGRYGDRSNLNVYCSSESGKISVRTTYLYGL